MNKKNLDFIIIGAQKAGTTPLYKYLQLHPMIYMLPEKEIDFFSLDSHYKKGWSWYKEKFFHEAPNNKLWGKATPSYMADMRVPQRLSQEMPDVKLIAILRNPIYRAFSQYKMEVRRGRENRSFERVIEEQIQKKYTNQDLAKFINGKEEKEYYLSLGEYGRILELYLDFVPKKNILCIFTEQMANNPQKILKKVLFFLNVDENFIPKNLKKQYHVGGLKKKISINSFDLAKNFWLNKIINNLRPRRYKNIYLDYWRRFLFWFEIWNVIPDSGISQMSTKTRNSLIEYYQNDVKKLSQLIEEQIPWLEFADLGNIVLEK